MFSYWVESEDADLPPLYLQDHSTQTEIEELLTQNEPTYSDNLSMK